MVKGRQEVPGEEKVMRATVETEGERQSGFHRLGREKLAYLTLHKRIKSNPRGDLLRERKVGMLDIRQEAGVHVKGSNGGLGRGESPSWRDTGWPEKQEEDQGGGPRMTGWGTLAIELKKQQSEGREGGGGKKWGKTRENDN